MTTINPKAGKPYPNTPAGRAASDAADKSLQRAADRKAANAKANRFGSGKPKLAKKKKVMAKGPYKTRKAGAKKPKSRGY